MFAFYILVISFLLFFQATFAIKLFSSNNNNEECHKHYILFFCDKSKNVGSNITYQLDIIETYFEGNFQTLEESYTTVVGQGEISLNNNFSIIQPEDVNTLNEYIIKIYMLPPNQNEISYLDLIKEFYTQLTLVDKQIYTDYPAIVFFINSYLKDLQSTKTVLEKIKNEQMSNLKTFAVIFDEKYTENATFLVDNSDVFNFQYNGAQTSYDNIISSILEKLCNNSETTTIPIFSTQTPYSYLTSTSSLGTTKATNSSKICKTYISFAIDTNNQTLSENQFEFMKGVVLNNISSLITDYSKVSIDSFDIKYNRWFTFGEISTIQEFMMNIYILKQRKMSNFYLLMQRLNMLSIPNDWSISTYVFVEQISKNEVNKSIEEAKLLQSKGTLNFIIIGNNTLETDLNPLKPSNTFLWNLTDSSINNLEKFFLNSMACDNV